MWPFPQPRSQIVFTPSSFFTSSTNTRVSCSPDSPFPACSACHSNSVYVGAAIQYFLVELDQMLRGVLPRVLPRHLLTGTAAFRELSFVAKRFGEFRRQCFFVYSGHPAGVGGDDLRCEIHAGTHEHGHRL